MIHSEHVIARIIDLLKLSGVSKEESIEEMTDHYLSHIERAVSNGISEQTAIRNTFQQIAITDLKDIDRFTIQKGNWLVGTVVLTAIILLLLVKCKKEIIEVSPLNNQATTLPTGWPTDQNLNEIASSFGYKMHSINQVKKFHKGIDIKAKKGTKVLATGDGIVIESDYNVKYGHYIVVKHNDEYATKFAHLSQRNVDTDKVIKKGDVIGLVGNTGMSLIPHLHYEVIQNDNVVDPLSVIAP